VRGPISSLQLLYGPTDERTLVVGIGAPGAQVHELRMTLTLGRLDTRSLATALRDLADALDGAPAGQTG
jgi:hypothetical protein